MGNAQKIKRKKSTKHPPFEGNTHSSGESDAFLQSIAYISDCVPFSCRLRPFLQSIAYISDWVPFSSRLRISLIESLSPVDWRISLIASLSPIELRISPIPSLSTNHIRFFVSSKCYILSTPTFHNHVLYTYNIILKIYSIILAHLFYAFLSLYIEFFTDLVRPYLHLDNEQSEAENRNIALWQDTT